MMKHTTFQSLINKVKSQAGFTMIELLIVIAILGILAVAVLSAINPVEQINRGRDTGTRSDAEQLIGGIDRFNAFKGYYPWMVDADSTDTDIPTVGGLLQQVDDSWVDDGSPACQVRDKLADGDGANCEGANELKETFFSRVIDSGSARDLYVYNEGGQGDSTYVCFYPQSAAFLTEAQERCAAGLPDDLISQNAIVCEVDNEMVCLP